MSTSGRLRPARRGDDGRHGTPRVAFVIDAIHPYHHGGKELRYYELARRLSGRATVHVYTMRWWAGPRRRAGDGVVFHAISPLLPMYARSRRSLLQSFIFGIACLRLLTERFDVLDADQIPYFQVLVLRLVASVKRKPFIVTWHEVWDKSYWRDYMGFLGLLAWRFERLCARLPDHIIAASPQTAERLRAYLQRDCPVTAIPNGIDLQQIRQAAPAPSATDLVLVSRLLPHKRVDMLLDAIAILHAEGLLLTCRIIGDGPERAALSRQAQALGIAHAVDFRHDVSDQGEIFAFLKSARVFVFPSAREGFGIGVLEAIACGLPVVTTSAADNLAQHLVLESGLGYVCPPSAQALAVAVRRVSPAEPPAGHSETASWLGAYDWEAIANRVAEVLGV